MILSASVICVAQDDYEPDEETAQATPLLPDQPQFNHSIEPAGDYDLVTFTLEKDSKVIVGTTGDSGSTNINLYNEAAEIIRYESTSNYSDFAWRHRP